MNGLRMHMLSGLGKKKEREGEQREGLRERVRETEREREREREISKNIIVLQKNDKIQALEGA